MFPRPFVKNVLHQVRPRWSSVHFSSIDEPSRPFKHAGRRQFRPSPANLIRSVCMELYVNVSLRRNHRNVSLCSFVGRRKEQLQVELNPSPRTLRAPAASPPGDSRQLLAPHGPGASSSVIPSRSSRAARPAWRCFSAGASRCCGSPARCKPHPRLTPPLPPDQSLLSRSLLSPPRRQLR
jgi:hypothetical protein